MAKGPPWIISNQERKPLPSRLDEFRTALEKEIEAASRRSAATAVPLIDGKLIGTAAQSRQYAFKLDTVLNTPSDTPGELKVPDRPRMSVTIVSVEGLRIVVSVEENLGGFVPKAWLQTDLSMLMKKLVQRIEAKSEVPNFGGDRMLGSSPVSGEPADMELDPARLNDGQQTAVRSAIGRNLTAIWGPPGTGKTHTIGQIVLNLYNRDRSVLIVSHTNIAVDQAVLTVAKDNGMRKSLESGAVVRVGQVQSKELLTNFTDVLLKSQIERKSAGLLAERQRLAEEKLLLEKEVHEQRRKLDLKAWIPTGNALLDKLHSAQARVGQGEASLRKLLATKDTSEGARASLKANHSRLTRLLQLRKLSEAEQFKVNSIRAEIRKLETRLSAAEQAVHHHMGRSVLAERIEPLRQERASYPNESEQNRIISKLHEDIGRKEREWMTFRTSLKELEATLDAAQNHNAFGRAIRRLPNPIEQRAKVDALRSEIDARASQITAGRHAIAAQERKLARIIEIDSELSNHNSVGTQASELNRKRVFEIEVQRLREELKCEHGKLSQAEAASKEIEKQVEALHPLPSNLNETYRRVCDELHELSDLPRKIEEARRNALEAENEFDEGMRELERAITGFDGEIGSFADRAESISRVSIAISDLEFQVAGINPRELESEVKKRETVIRGIDLRIAGIDEKLAAVERTVIRDAKVLGATLTKTYLSDAIQERTFDTVILDEASMAPIPALWVAASLARENLIIVGDFKQLPPICISDHPIAKKWLGEDIFEVSGLRESHERGESPVHFVVLNQQFRMRPEIADVANLFYGILKSDGAPKVDSESFLRWFNREWEFDKSPVCVVDTSGLHAWVTSIPRGEGASRLNFLSATLCVDLAEQVLGRGRPRPDGGDRRVLIVSPYQPHAKLIRLMIEQNDNIRDEVESGTVHSFQGSEADVVIFDLVVDEPHWRANLFYPAADEGNKRIYNVAMTRARQRLIVVGNLEWCAKGGKSVYLGKTLIPFLRREYPVFSAKDVIPHGLAGRAARAQMAMLGGAIEADSERVVVTQTDFFRLLATDIERSHSRIVIYSPFLTQKRVSFLLPQIQDAIERKVAVFVVTKCHSERSPSDLPTLRQIESLLQQVGVIILRKMRMHEKLVLIDDDVTWSGSLNPLSFSDTQEVMERRKNKEVQGDFREALRVDELLGTSGRPEAVCPICGCAMVACEGDGDPFYWRCESDKRHYTRNIGAPYPIDGLMSCRTCGGELEFGEWGGEPHWRCCKDKQHRMRIFSSHLKLPKMVALIPKRELKKMLRGTEVNGGQRDESDNEPVQGQFW